jgi:hypothetical protein
MNIDSNRSLPRQSLYLKRENERERVREKDTKINFR